MEHDEITDDATDEDDQKPQPSEDIRKSGRKKRPPASYSPERTEIKRRRVFKKNAVNSTNRKCDLLPNGEPFSCGRCGSPYVVNKRSKTSLKNCQSRHRPMPYEIYDPITKKNLLICNFCYLIFVKQRAKRASLTKKPEPEVKEHYLQTCQVEAQALANRLQKPEANRLFCPEYSKEPCGCIQKYLKNQGDPGQADVRARELCDLLQKALQLAKLKFYPLPELDSNDKPIRKNARKKNFVGLGMGHKRSRAFEAFVMEKRQYLRNVVKLCERGCQKVLAYSNNFLHKRLRTEKDNCRVVIQRSKRTMGLLTAFEEFSKNKCCVDNCVKMADTHRKLLADWRERARTSQIEARRVIAEMLIPSAGCSKNCYNFINMVTGSSKGVISKVSQQMLWTGGDKEPPVHGLVKKANSIKAEAHTQSQPQPLIKANTDVSAVVNPSLDVQDIYGQPSGELEQVSGHPEGQTHSQPDPKQQAVISPDSQQQQLLQLQQIFEHQQQQLIQQQLLQHTLLNERMDNSSCTAQNVISIQQLMDQMSVQVMNTQLQLQQSLQQLIAMGTQSNQSELSVPTVNQSQLILPANQQHRGVIVTNQQENLQENTLIRPPPTDQHTTVDQTPQPVYIQLNQSVGQTSYIQGLPMTQPNYLTPVGTFVYSRGNSTFIPYNQSGISSSNSAQTGVSTVNSSFSQTANMQCTTTASTARAINGGDRIQSSSSGSAFVTVSKPTENVTPNVVTSVTKSQPSQITVVYPGTKSFVKQKVPASTSSSSVANDSTVGVLRSGVRALGDTQNMRYSVAPTARQVTNHAKESFATYATSVPLNPAKTSDQGQTVASFPISTPNCVPPSSDKVIQVQAITDPNMLLKLLEQSSCVQTPNSTTSTKPAPVTSTFMGEADNTRINSVVHINPNQGNILVQENHSQVIHVSSVPTGITNSTNVNPPSYTYIFNPTTPPSQPVTVDVGHQIEQPPAAVATTMNSNIAPNSGGAMNCVNSPNTGLATQNLPNPQLVAIDPNLLIRLCQQAFSYQALDPSKDRPKKTQ